MKKIVEYIFVLLGFYILVELNTGTIIADVKGIFQPSNHEIFERSNLTGMEIIPNDFLKLLKIKSIDRYTNKLSFVYTNGYKLNDPISTFVYDNKYYLLTFKLSNSYNLSLKTSVKEYYINASNFGFSIGDERSAVNYSYKSSSTDNITKIYLKLLGKNNQVIFKNDTMAYYHSQFNEFSVQYDLSNPDVLYGEPKGNNLFSNTFLPIEILFIKKNQNLYLLVMSIYKDKDANSPMQTGTLYNLLKN